MEDVTIGGETLISTTRASQLSGYSKDYIGQLCREDKIECRRVSGHWYVDEEGLKRYQENGVDADIKNKNVQGTSALGMKVGNVRDDTFKYNGTEYIATSRAAAVTGYAQDYIGQLARSGELEARKVGRRWFVGKDSLIAHKKHNDGLLAEVQAQASGIRSQKESVEDVSVQSDDASLAVHIQRDVEPGDINFNVRYVAESNSEIPYAKKETVFNDVQTYASGDILGERAPIKQMNPDIRPISTLKAVPPINPQTMPRSISSREGGVQKKGQEESYFIESKPTKRSFSIIGVVGMLVLVLVIISAGAYLYLFGLSDFDAISNLFEDNTFIEMMRDKYGDVLPGSEFNYSSE
tara:strand:- start:355 stop:1407 length:1053 start_codon:yes stop_codon:yes gene_type:complete